MRKFFAMLWLAACLLPLGCGQMPVGKGIELGNPEPEIIEKVRVTPMTGETSYEFHFRSDQTAEARRIVDGSVLETVTVPFQKQNDSFRVIADFSGAEQVDVFVRFDASGTIVQGNLQINGVPVAASFEANSVPGAEPPKNHQTLPFPDELPKPEMSEPPPPTSLPARQPTAPLEDDFAIDTVTLEP